MSYLSWYSLKKKKLLLDLLQHVLNECTPGVFYSSQLSTVTSIYVTVHQELVTFAVIGTEDRTRTDISIKTGTDFVITLGRCSLRVSQSCIRLSAASLDFRSIFIVAYSAL